MEDDYERLKQLIAINKCKEPVPENIKIYREDRKVYTVYDVATFTDDYALKHKRFTSKFGSPFELGSVPDRNHEPCSGPNFQSNKSCGPNRSFTSYTSTSMNSSGLNPKRNNS